MTTTFVFLGFYPESKALPWGGGCIQGGCPGIYSLYIETQILIWRSRGNRDFWYTPAAAWAAYEDRSYTGSPFFKAQRRGPRDSYRGYRQTFESVRPNGRQSGNLGSARDHRRCAERPSSVCWDQGTLPRCLSQFLSVWIREIALRGRSLFVCTFASAGIDHD